MDFQSGRRQALIMVFLPTAAITDQLSKSSTVVLILKCPGIDRPGIEPNPLRSSYRRASTRKARPRDASVFLPFLGLIEKKKKNGSRSLSKPCNRYGLMSSGSTSVHSIRSSDCVGKFNSEVRIKVSRKRNQLSSGARYGASSPYRYQRCPHCVRSLR